MLINDKNYTMPELNFNTMCQLEDMGISLTEMDKKVLTTVRGFLALAMDGDHEKAGKELQLHLENGGSMDHIVQEINHAVEESGFFQAMNGRQKSQPDAGNLPSGK